MYSWTKKGRLIISFYKNFAFSSILISGLCVWIVYKQGWATFNAVFWMKVITSGIIHWFVSDLKKQEFYYYQNLGLSQLYLSIGAWAIDFFIFFLLFYILP